MNYLHRFSILALFFLFTESTFSAPGVDVTRDFWQCTVLDSNKMQWTAQSNYQKTAMNNAIDDCKKESKLPASCAIAGRNCEEFNASLSDRPKWRCVAIDHTGMGWDSIFTPSRDGAAFSAIGACKSESKFPYTCYMNMVTCSVYIGGARQL